jgi:alpha/beta superfamily hydrolase
MHVTIPGPAGPLEGLLDLPAPSGAGTGPAQDAGDAGEGSDAGEAAAPRAAVVFGHPHPEHGGTMHTKAVFQGAKGLTRIGCAVLRFNFRGVGASAGVFDRGEGEMADFKAALDFMAARYPGLPLWAAGFSFGSWVALEVGAEDPRVTVLIGIAPPVARDGYSFPNTRATDKPKFFVQGDMDELCPITSLWAFYAQLREPKELVVIGGANHLFETQTREVGEALEDLLGDFE